MERRGSRHTQSCPAPASCPQTLSCSALPVAVLLGWKTQLQRRAGTQREGHHQAYEMAGSRTAQHGNGDSDCRGMIRARGGFVSPGSFFWPLHSAESPQEGSGRRSLGTQSWNYGIVLVGRDCKDHPIPTVDRDTFHNIGLLKASSSLLFQMWSIHSFSRLPIPHHPDSKEILSYI